MACQISVSYPGTKRDPIVLDIPETRRGHGVISFGSDSSVCFGSAPGMGGFAIDPWEAEEYGILPRHCALVWAGGVFRLDFDQRAGVYLNDSRYCARELCNPFEHSTEFTMRLGHLGNHPDVEMAPVFHVRRTDLVAEKRSLLQRLSLRYDWVRRTLILPHLVRLPMLVLLTTLGLASLAIVDKLQGEAMSAALVRIPVSEEISAALAPSVASIGVVCSQDAQSGESDRSFSAKGTAWLFKNQGSLRDAERWIVTNAHVVDQLRASNTCEPGYSSQTLAIFPGRADGNVTPIEFPIAEFGDRKFVRHPLYKLFNESDLLRSTTAPGQSKTANIYDLAAYKLRPNELSEKDRIFLELEIAERDKKPDEERATSAHVFEPGRPILVMGYPIENVPFLANGVSGRPFEFRSNVQSRANALSRELRGPSDTFTPALYSFSGKSAGGISGSPVVSLDHNNKILLVGIAFSGSFIAEYKSVSPETITSQQDQSSGAVGHASQQISRTPIGDTVYALDAISLHTISDWPTAKFKDMQKRWETWVDWREPFNRAHARFLEITNPTNNQCPQGFTKEQPRTLKLSRRLDTLGKKEHRGENRDPLELNITENMLIEGTLPTQDANEIVQVTIRSKDAPSTAPIRLADVGGVSYLYEAPLPFDAVVAFSGPLGSEVTVSILRANNNTTSCNDSALATGDSN